MIITGILVAGIVVYTIWLYVRSGATIKMETVVAAVAVAAHPRIFVESKGGRALKIRSLFRPVIYLAVLAVGAWWIWKYVRI